MGICAGCPTRQDQRGGGGEFVEAPRAAPVNQERASASHCCCAGATIDSGLDVQQTHGSPRDALSPDSEKQAAEMHVTGVGLNQQPSPSPCASDGSQFKGCRMRIVAVNDVYQLTNFPRLKTLVAKESVGFHPDNVVTTLAGDFLAPSLLSSLDAGFGMVAVMNEVPIKVVCFGNHDGNDIPYSKLVHRIAEYKGNWLNTNMPAFKPELPRSYVHQLRADDGSPARQVAFLGLCIGGGKFKAMYRDTAFGGAHSSIVPVLEAAPRAVEECRRTTPHLSAIIPITHQDMPEDVALAKSGAYPVVVAGHDHERLHEVHGENACHVVKAGMDAKDAAVIDLVWAEGADAQPTVTVEFKALADYEEDAGLAAQIDKINGPVKELESAMLYELNPGQEITSVGAKYHDVSMAQMLASAIRDCLGADAAVVNSGAVRGNKTYGRAISYGDLKAECPYPSAVVVTRMPFSVLRSAVEVSRKPWKEAGKVGDKKDTPSALQADDGIRMEDHIPMTICGGAPDGDDRMYTVACDTYFLKKNVVFKDYCKSYPERIPPEDAGRPLLPILVEFFCKEIWRKLLASTPVARTSSGRAHEMLSEENVHEMFESFDLDKNGNIEVAELQTAIRSRLGENLSSKIIVEQMVQLMDYNGDGQVNERELLEGIRKLNHKDWQGDIPS